MENNVSGIVPSQWDRFQNLKKKPTVKTPILLQYLIQYMLDKLFKGMSKTSAEEERKMYPMSAGSNTDGLQHVSMSGGTVGVSWSHTNLMYHCHKAAYCTYFCRNKIKKEPPDLSS